GGDDELAGEVADGGGAAVFLPNGGADDIADEGDEVLAFLFGGFVAGARAAGPGAAALGDVGEVEGWRRDDAVVGHDQVVDDVDFRDEDFVGFVLGGDFDHVGVGVENEEGAGGCLVEDEAEHFAEGEFADLEADGGVL